jgi:glycosyltransferase involved in cell wall biosynthesis
MPQIAHNTYHIGSTGFGISAVAVQLAKHQCQIGLFAEVWHQDTDLNGVDLDPRDLRYFKEDFAGFSREQFAYAGSSKIDIVHQHGTWTANSIATLQAKRFGAKTVITPHGALHYWAMNKSKLKKMLALLTYEGKNLKQADAIHALSHEERHCTRQLGIKVPIAVIPNGVDSQYFTYQPNIQAFRNQWGIGDVPFMLYLSRVTPKKGIANLFKAFHKLLDLAPDFKIVIAGPDEFNHKIELEALAKELNIQDRVIFTGSLSGKDKLNAYHAAHFFVLPSLSEGMPMVVLEAMASGKAVFATFASPIPEIETRGCGIRTESTLEGIQDGLRFMLEQSPEQLEQMGKNSREVILETYTWEKVALMTEELYNWLLGKAPKPDFVYLD